MKRESEPVFMVESEWILDGDGWEDVKVERRGVRETSASSLVRYGQCAVVCGPPVGACSILTRRR